MAIQRWVKKVQDKVSETPGVGAIPITPSTGPSAGTLDDWISPSRLVQGGQRNASVLASPCPSIGNIVLASGTAYFVYVGTVATAQIWKRLRFQIGGGGAGAQTAEAGLFSSPNPPDGTAQTLTKLEVTTALDDLTTTGFKTNGADLSGAPAAGTNVWTGIRVVMATTQPSVRGCAFDLGIGYALILAGASALNTYTTVSPALIGVSILPTFPDLRATVF